MAPDYGADIAAFAAATFGQGALIGWSLGAVSVVVAVYSNPGIATAVVLRDPPLSVFDDDRFVESMRSMQASLPTTKVDETSILELQQRNTTLSEYAAREILTARTQVDPAFLTPMIERRLFEGIDYHTALRSLAVPTLLVQGDAQAGGLLSDGDIAVIKELIPRAEVVKFYGRGHALDVYQPGGPLDVITGFLERTLRRSA